MSDEIELKLGLPRKAVAALRRHPLFAAAEKQGNAVTLDNTYYDTAELALKNKRIALRTRRHGRTWLQTVKCGALSTGGLTHRPEWEQPFDGSFDFSLVTATRVRKFLTRIEPQLVPVFSTRFRRETRAYAPDDRVRILMMIDTGEVIAGERTEPICELELELERGRPLDLLLLACRLVADLPLLPDDVSKAERGYRLHLDQKPQPARAEVSEIEPDQSPVEAFRTLAFSCIRQWQANARAATAGKDPEFIHQLRVSQRRLRSLIRLFSPALPEAFASDWSERLRQNANSFGDARDLDVLCDEIVAPAAAERADEDPAIVRLQTIVNEARERAREHALEGLDPVSQGRLLIGFMAALHALPSNNLIGAADLRKFARLQLTRLRRKIRKRFESARGLVPARLHALRIALKQLRYGVEFFAPLMPPKSLARYMKALARAQNALGFINDVDVAKAALVKWAGDDSEMRSAAAFICGWHSPRYARLCRRSIRELEPLLYARAPWNR